MGIAAILNALKRGTTTVDQRLEASGRGALHISKDLPDLATLVKEGVVWSAGEAAATAGVVALPTTTAGITLYNNEPQGGKHYILVAVFATQVANAAAQASWHLAHCIHRLTPTTRPTADIAAASITNMLTPAPTYGGNAIIDLGATVVDDLWKNIGPSVNTAVVSLSGTAIYVPLYGTVVMGPGGEYSLESIVSAVDITTRMGFTWAEVQL